MTLSDAQRAELRAKLPPEGSDGSVASRAQIVLWHDEGHSAPEIAAMMGTSKVTVYKWLQRYQEGGLAALESRKSTGRPREMSSEVRSRILALTKQSPPESTGPSHWPGYEMARYLKSHEGIEVSHNFVSVLWRENGIKPHRQGTFKLSRDPDFAAKVVDVVGLYLDPPAGAVVLSVDEKTHEHTVQARVCWPSPDALTWTSAPTSRPGSITGGPGPAGLTANRLQSTVADGRHAVVSCEFSAKLLWIDIRARKVGKTLALGKAMSAPVTPPGSGYSLPQDVRLSADGRIFYVADMAANGIWLINAHRFKVMRFLHTGTGTHGFSVSRNGKYLYISNRGEGSISVLDFATNKLVHKWWIPGGGSPDMGGVSPDGKVMWWSGRYHSVVYAISTGSGRLLAKIPVGAGPHGLCVFPQPGRYSLGHTGNFR